MTKDELKHISELLKACSEGKVIQVNIRTSDNPLWVDLDTTNWYPNPNYFYYRIKPPLKLRPYLSAEEFLNDEAKHGPRIDTGTFTLVSRVDDKLGISFEYDSCSWFSFEIIAKYYKWQDGSPCGVMEE